VWLAAHPGAEAEADEEEEEEDGDAAMAALLSQAARDVDADNQRDIDALAAQQGGGGDGEEDEDGGGTASGAAESDNQRRARRARERREREREKRQEQWEAMSAGGREAAGRKLDLADDMDPDNQDKVKYSALTLETLVWAVREVKPFTSADSADPKLNHWIEVAELYNGKLEELVAAGLAGGARTRTAVALYTRWLAGPPRVDDGSFVVSGVHDTNQVSCSPVALAPLNPSASLTLPFPTPPAQPGANRAWELRDKWAAARAELDDDMSGRDMVAHAPAGASAAESARGAVVGAAAAAAARGGKARADKAVAAAAKRAAAAARGRGGGRVGGRGGGRGAGAAKAARSAQVDVVDDDDDDDGGGGGGGGAGAGAGSGGHYAGSYPMAGSAGKGSSGGRSDYVMSELSSARPKGAPGSQRGLGNGRQNADALFASALAALAAPSAGAAAADSEQSIAMYQATASEAVRKDILSKIHLERALAGDVLSAEFIVDCKAGTAARIRAIEQQCAARRKALTAAPAAAAAAEEEEQGEEEEG